MGALKSILHVGISLLIGFILVVLSIQVLSSVDSAASTPLMENIKIVKSTGATSFTGVTEWHTETVSTIARGASSIAVDSSGYPRISYQYDNDGTLMNFKLGYAQWTGAEWVKTMVDSVEFGTATSLALDNNGNPHISYAVCNPFYCLANYAEWTGSNWLITEDLDGFGSLAIDTSGNPHISYMYGIMAGMTSLDYMYREAGTWISNTVDLNPSSRYISLKLDGSDYPHISYYKEETLQYAYLSGSEWITQVIDSVLYNVGLGQITSLALDDSDAPHIAYYDGESLDLKYAAWDGTGWVIETVDSSGDVGKYASLVLDSSGSPHISYYDADNQAIKSAHRLGTGWQTNLVEVGVGGGDVTSLAIDTDDRLHLSYYYYNSSTDRALRYAYVDTVLYEEYSVYLPLVIKD